MGVLESAKVYGDQIRESANDGSDFSNAVTDYRILFVGEDGLFHLKDSAGTVTTPTGMADPMTTRGDIIYRNASNVTDRLALPLAGQVIGRSGSDLAAVYPPGYQVDYVQITSSVNISGTAETSGGATTVITGTSQSYAAGDYWVEFYANQAYPVAVSGAYLVIHLWDGTTEIGDIAVIQNVNTGGATAPLNVPVFTRNKITLTAATHQLIIRAHVTNANGVIQAGAGGSATRMPSYIRVVTA